MPPSLPLVPGYTKAPPGTPKLRTGPGRLPGTASRLRGASVPTGPPPAWIWLPRSLSYWLNNQYGDCVTAEEAFAKACSGVFISDTVVQSWASKNDVLDGAELDQVLDLMAKAGFAQDGNTYNDGAKLAVDWTNALELPSAISQGPVKIGVASSQLDGVVGTANGWFATGFSQDSSEDHSVSLCGYGTMAQLGEWLGFSVPAGVDGTKPGYALFTWDTIGVIDLPSMAAITGEAWLRTPTTVIVGSGAPTPDVVWTPPPPPPTVPAPGPAPIVVSPEPRQALLTCLEAMFEGVMGVPFLTALQAFLGCMVSGGGAPPSQGRVIGHTHSPSGPWLPARPWCVGISGT